MMKKRTNKNKSTKKYKTTYIDSRKNNKPWLITVLAAMLLTLVVIIVMALVSDPGAQNPSDDATPDSVGVTLATTPDETTLEDFTQPSEAEKQTEAELISDENQPAELTELLSTLGYGYQYLDTLGCSQLVTVDSDPYNTTSAQLKLWECNDGLWSEVENLSCQGYVGSMGTVDHMSETISGTPRGLYGIGEAFYRNSEPQTGLASFMITNDTYWVDDPNSYFYNQRVVGTDNKDWNSAEPMAQYSAYNYGFVVEYNMYPTVAGAGSAIFFHIGYGPTEGCIATSEDMVLSYLSVLTESLNPCILVD